MQYRFDDPALASAAGKRGGASLKNTRPREHFVAMGKAGDAANRDNHGPDHFRELGRRGAQIRWERARARQAAEATDS